MVFLKQTLVTPVLILRPLQQPSAGSCVRRCDSGVTSVHIIKSELLENLLARLRISLRDLINLCRTFVQPCPFCEP
jgi:hypothetical protein